MKKDEKRYSMVECSACKNNCLVISKTDKIPYTCLFNSSSSHPPTNFKKLSVEADEVVVHLVEEQNK